MASSAGPLIPLTNDVVGRPWCFWVVDSNPTIPNNKLFQTFPLIELEKYFSRYPQEIKQLDIDRSARISGPHLLSRRFRGEECCKA